MFFGLCNSPLTFQAMMNDTLKDEIKEGFCIIYMDNILIFAKNKEDLECFTKQVLESLQKADLYLKPSKCEFCKMKIEYVSWPYYRRRQDDDGPHQTQWNLRLVNPQEHKTSALFPWIWKLLSMLHSEIL